MAGTAEAKREGSQRETGGAQEDAGVEVDMVADDANGDGADGPAGTEQKVADREDPLFVAADAADDEGDGQRDGWADAYSAQEKG